VDSWFFLSFPRCVDSAIAGLEKAKNPSGENVRRLIQIFFIGKRLLRKPVRICLVRRRLIFMQGIALYAVNWLVCAHHLRS